MAQKPSIPKGTRDFNAEEVAKRTYIIETIKEQFQLYGFQPIETPSFENSETLMGKYGDEGDRLIFKILESGDYLNKAEEENIESSISIYLTFSYIFKDLLYFMFDKLDESGFDFSEKSNLEKFKSDEKIRDFANYKTKEWSTFLIEDVDLSYRTADLINQDLESLINFVVNFIWERGLDFKKKRKDKALVDWQIKWADRRLIKDYSKSFLKKISDNLPPNYSKIRNSVVHGISSKISEKALRYDLTVPFARYVVQHQNEIAFPFKRYQIQPVWRADRPQKGRFREFYQCDADVVGSKSLFQEVEFIQLYDAVFTALKLKGVTIKINNRKILSGIAEVIGAQDKLIDFTVALDKLDKIGEEKVKEEMRSKGISEDGINQLQPLFSLQGDFASQIESLTSILNTSEVGLKGIEELEFIDTAITSLGLKTAKLQLDVTLARGLNYYTGAIFEVAAPEGVKMGSIGGGGRYDDLTSIFGKPDTSGVGISFGLDRIYLVIEELGLFPETIADATKVLFINFGDTEALACLKAISKLREKGIKAELYPDAAKMKKQMPYANRRGIPYVVLVGEQELNSKTFTLKTMASGEQQTLDIDALLKALK